MAQYDFRLRFNFSEAYRINSDDSEIELLNLPSGEYIKLYSGDRQKSIKDCESPAVIGKLFASEDEAMLAAQQSKRALLYWSIKQRVGIDFGDGKQRSIVTKAGLSYFEKQWGCPVRNDIHGIDIYEHVEELKFVRSSAKPRVGKHLPRLVNTFQHEFAGKRHFTEKQLLASEIYASSFLMCHPVVASSRLLQQ